MRLLDGLRPQLTGSAHLLSRSPLLPTAFDVSLPGRGKPTKVQCLAAGFATRRPSRHAWPVGRRPGNQRQRLRGKPQWSSAGTTARPADSRPWAQPCSPAAPEAKPRPRRRPTQAALEEAAPKEAEYHAVYR
jgi:hypothetical protein